MIEIRRRKVLLVDDERNIVEGLQRVLRPHRASWEVTTSTSPFDALEMLQAASYDVVVSDMRMPEMDGAALLSAAKAKCPATMRIMLSGQTDAEAAMRTVGVAHQFLSKPTDPSTLLDTLKRIVVTRDAITDPAVLEAIGSLGALPSLPRLCNLLTSLASAEAPVVADLVAAIEREPAVVLKLLQLVNSSFFGLRRQMSNVTDAVVYLGTDLVKNLVVSLSIVNSLPVRAVRFDADAFQRRAIAIAQLARCVGGKGEVGDAAFVAGMLHDIGRLVMAFAMPDRYDAIAERAHANGRSFADEDAAEGGCGHLKIGAYLLDLWGLPNAVVEALAVHSDVHACANVAVRPADALYIARKLVDAPDALFNDDDQAHLRRLGILERLPSFVARAGELGAAS